MRGSDSQSAQLFSCISIEDKIDEAHPLRLIRALRLIRETVNECLSGMCSDFDALTFSWRPPVEQAAYRHSGYKTKTGKAECFIQTAIRE